MGLLQVGASVLTSLLIGALARFARAARTYLLLAFSILAVYWFQPLVPLRSFDFWLPTLTLGLVVLTWFLISPGDSHPEERTPEAASPTAGSSRPSAWRSRSNLIALALIAGLPVLIDL